MYYTRIPRALSDYWVRSPTSLLEEYIGDPFGQFGGSAQTTTTIKAIAFIVVMTKGSFVQTKGLFD
jgi:hypothetical protein